MLLWSISRLFHQFLICFSIKFRISWMELRIFYHSHFMRGITSLLSMCHGLVGACNHDATKCYESCVHYQLNLMCTIDGRWPKFVQSVQSILQNFPSGFHKVGTPLHVHTGQPSGNPLCVPLAVQNIEDVSDERLASMTWKLKIEDEHTTLDHMHGEFHTALTHERKEAVRQHNQNTHVRSFNPTVGDYVVDGRDSVIRTKISTSWIGPRHIVSIKNNFVVLSEHLLTNATTEVQLSMIKH